MSLLNDCKYGHDIRDKVMRITLIKCATAPDPEADQGQHRFTYSLLPHAGDWRTETVRRARELNHPVLTRRIVGAKPGVLAARNTYVEVLPEHVILETIKPAEDGDGAILRFYEAHNRRGRVTVRFGVPPGGVEVQDLLERPLPLQGLDLRHDGGRVDFQIKPHQIVTLRVR